MDKPGKIIMLRSVLCRVAGRKKQFNARQQYSADFAGWLPAGSYEQMDDTPLPPVPVPNEITVDYDG